MWTRSASRIRSSSDQSAPVAVLPAIATAGSEPVPVWFRSDPASTPACQSPIPQGRRSSPGGAERGGTLLEPVTSGSQRIPIEFPGSDVKLRASGCLCAGVDERPPSPHAHNWPRADVADSAPRGPDSAFSPTPRRDGPSRAPGTSVEPARRQRGVPPLNIEQTTADVQAIHRLAASRLRRATATSPPRPARAPSGNPREGRRPGP